MCVMKVILNAVWRGRRGGAGPSTTRWPPRVTSSPGDRGIGLRARVARLRSSSSPVSMAGPRIEDASQGWGRDKLN